MSSNKFYKKSAPYKLKDILNIISCDIKEIIKLNNISNDEMEKILIHDIKTLKKASAVDISFLHNKKYINDFKNTNAVACLVPFDFKCDEENLNFDINAQRRKTILIKVKNTYFVYAQLVDIFYTARKIYKSSIMPSAYISKYAKIGGNCYIGHNVVIEDYAEIGDNSIIESGTHINYGVKIGNKARIDTNVVISSATIGDNVVILPGAKIGQDGFGFATENGVHKKILHTGQVIIGDDVEIGANTTIDRGSNSDTIIEDLCRIDNLVQIAHNVIVKKGTIIVSQSGVAGSSTIGKYCVLGGQSGISGHLNITDNVQIAGRGGVIQDINQPGTVVGGFPAVQIRDWHKQTIILKKLVNKTKND